MLLSAINVMYGRKLANFVVLFSSCTKSPHVPQFIIKWLARHPSFRKTHLCSIAHCSRLVTWLLAAGRPMRETGLKTRSRHLVDSESDIHSCPAPAKYGKRIDGEVALASKRDARRRLSLQNKRSLMQLQGGSGHRYSRIALLNCVMWHGPSSIIAHNHGL